MTWAKIILAICGQIGFVYLILRYLHGGFTWQHAPRYTLQHVPNYNMLGKLTIELESPGYTKAKKLFIRVHDMYGRHMDESLISDIWSSNGYYLVMYDSKELIVVHPDTTNIWFLTPEMV